MKNQKLFDELRNAMKKLPPQNVNEVCDVLSELVIKTISTVKEYENIKRRKMQMMLVYFKPNSMVTKRDMDEVELEEKKLENKLTGVENFFENLSNNINKT